MTGRDEIMDVSIVIVNWNTRELLRACLDSVIREGSGLKQELIVVDNASGDGSAAMMRERFPEVIVVENGENIGFGRATNQGMRIAKGRYVLMLNSDTVIQDGAIAKTVQFADRVKDAGIVGCRILYPDGRAQSSCFRFPGLFGLLMTSANLSQLFPKNGVLNWDRYGEKEWHEVREVDCVMGGYMLIRREVLDEVGMLDEGYFMYAEETDFCCRVKRKGWKVVFYHGAEIVHHHSGSQKNAKDAAWAFGAKQRGIFLFLYKWKPLWYVLLCNLIFLTGLAVKTILWAGQDLITGIRRIGPLEAKKFMKAGCFGFHMRAMVKPALFASPWGKR